MTDIQSTVAENRGAGVRRMKKNNLKIDMTPVVDLGFLLINFLYLQQN